MAVTPPHFDTFIIGGGIVGLSLAWELSNRGFNVGMAESGPIGRGASWAGAGILPPAAKNQAVDPLDQMKSLSHCLHPEWAHRLQKETGIDTGFRRCGGLYLARTAAECATLIANELWWDEHAVDYQRMSRDELVALESNLSEVADEVKSAWLLPDEYQLRNPHHLRALQSACELNGVAFFEGTKIVDLKLCAQTAVSALAANGRTFRAKQFCICAGAWARDFLIRRNIPNGIMPIRGQMVLYRGSEKHLSRIVNEGNRYLVPRDDGRLLAGSIEEEAGFDCRTTEQGVALIREWAEQVLPKLASCEVEASWAGLRPGSFDGLPYLGCLPDTENLFIASGHFRSGLHLSCATATVMANLMQGLDVEIDLTPFRVARG